MPSGESYRRFVAICLAEMISSIGSGLSSFGLGVYVYQQTGLASASSKAGPLNDLLIPPLMMPGGLLAATLGGRVFGTGTGRGTALLVSLAGLMLIAAALMTHRNPALKDLERKATTI